MTISRRVILSILTFFLLIIVACDLDIPSSDMAKAKLKISEAEEVGAAEYDPGNLEKAKETLKESHTYLADSKADEAKDSAVQSKEYAQMAIDNTLPKLAVSEIKKAKEEFAKADALLASKLAPTEFQSSMKLVNSAVSKYNKKSYYPAYEDAKKSVTLSQQAQEASIAKIPELKQEATALKDSIAQAKQLKGAESQTANLDNASSMADNAISLFDEQKTKEGYVQLQNAKVTLNKTMPQIAATAISNASKAINEAQWVMADQFSPNNLNQAKSDLQAANQLNGQKNYVDAATKAQAAEEAALKAKEESLKQKPALQNQIAALKDKLQEHKLANGQNYAPNELATAESSLKVAESGLAKDQFKTTVDNISKAEQALKIADEKGKKYLVLKKIEAAVTTFNDVIKNKDMVKKYPQDLKEISSTIKASKTAYNGNDLNTADTKAEEALTMLDSLQLAYQKSLDAEPQEEEVAVEEEEVPEEPATDAEGFPKEYTVILNKADRDCLWKIAKKFYNKATLWPLIYSANKDQIKDPDLIFPGQTFQIPNPSGNTNKPNGSNEGAPKTYSPGN